MATRRAILGHLAVGLGVVATGAALAQPAEDAAYVAIETAANTGHSRALFFASSGRLLGRTPLDFRVHGMAQHGQAMVVFPRRPGNQMCVVDVVNLEIKRRLTAPFDRHFYGHGAFTRDGAYLLTTENNLDTLGGHVGVYDVRAGYRRVDDMVLPGAGPHEIIRAPHSDVFLLALGGLETHPDYGRTPFNLRDFRSQIVQVDIRRSEVLPLGHWSGTEGVSLRHLAQDGAGRLVIGGQVPKGRDPTGSVLWVVNKGVPQKVETEGRLGHYVSSVAAHGAQALVSSKVTGEVLRLVDGEMTSSDTLDGASAVALSDRFRAQSGFRALDINGQVYEADRGAEFDNHGFALSPMITL
ncbi:MAG: DUF1513 domain-containing protein [Marinovum sp.]|nr:DUF1513 domain-containing protein [Marinovum sp.]